MTYSDSFRNRARDLFISGSTIYTISKILDCSRYSVKEWVTGQTRYTKTSPRNPPNEFDDPRAFLQGKEAYYSYLLGCYLGDGHIVQVKNKKDLYKLRLFSNMKQLRVIEDQITAIKHVIERAPYLSIRPGCYEIVSNRKHLNRLFPQHGIGKKHKREIKLEPWQYDITKTFPKMFVRGLMDTDGCLFSPTPKTNWKAYSFSNCSDDIHRLIQEHLDLLDVKWTKPRKVETAVRKKSEAAKLYSFIPNKYDIVPISEECFWPLP